MPSQRDRRRFEWDRGHASFPAGACHGSRAVIALRAYYFFGGRPKHNIMAFNHIFKEVQFRFVWLIICFCLTCVCCYIFSEELLFLLAKPFLIVYKPNKAFISTQLTETLNTYITSSFIFSFVFCTPYFIYQMWCFLIPSCKQTQRTQLSSFCVLSAFAFVCVFSLSLLCLLPTIWSFLYKLSKNTSSNLLIIQLQPKIYDFIMLTIRFLFLSCVCSQIPVILLCLIEYNIIALQDFIQHRSKLWFCCVLIAALLTPPDLWCQLSALLFVYVLIEFTIMYALVRLHYGALCSSSA